MDRALQFDRVYLLCRTYLDVKLSLVVAVVRIVIPFSYFAWWYNPDWTHIDVIEYFQIGLQLFDTGQTPFILFSIEEFRHLRSLAGSWHILHQWWHLLAIALFGRALYAPIFLNVVLSVGVAMLFVHIVSNLNVSRSYCRWLFLLLALHWSAVTWSSVNNVKMFVVAFFTLALLYAAYEVLEFESSFRVVRALLIGLVASVALFNVRFYVPAFVFAAAAWGVFNGKAVVRGIILGASIVGGLIFLWIGRTSFYLLEPQLLLYGIVRIFLTPLRGERRSTIRISNRRCGSTGSRSPL